MVRQQLSEAGQSGVVILDRTPLWGERWASRGLWSPACYGGELDVTDTTKAQGHHLHHVTVTRECESRG